MTATENTEFEDFAAAFGDGDSYHTETEPEEEVQTEETEDTGTEVDEESEEETPEEDNEETDDAEKGAEQQPETPAADPAPETFTLKVNKEERTYTRDEVIALAQKGADYDRVKDKLAAQQQTVDDLAAVAKEMGMEAPALLEMLMVSSIAKKENVSEDVARERYLRQKAEKENTALRQAAATSQPAEETSQQRAQRELADFRKAYPDVPLTDELLKELMPDVQKNIPLKEAYERRESAKKDARIKELEAQLAAEQQNKKNRAASPGSQKDSGGRRKKTDFDDFVSAFT